MKPPPTQIRLLGHPVVSGALMLTGMAFVALCLVHGSQGVLPAIIVGLLLDRVLKAQERERDYRAWKRAWDNMDGDARTPRRGWLLAARTLTVLVAGFYAFTHLNDGTIRVALAFIAAAFVLALAVALARRLGWTARRTRRSQRTDPVILARGKPLLPVPSLPHAYAALPDYCQRLLRQS